MRKLYLRHVRSISLLAVFALFLAASVGIQASRSLNVGDHAPDWILSDSRGEAVSFYQDSDKQPAVLLFWSSWCPNCEELMPLLEQLYQEFGGKQVKFYALNIWEDGDPVAHMEERDFSFTLLLDADMVANRYRVRGTPGLFVVNEDKSIQYIRSNGSSADEVYRAVRTALSASNN